MKAFNDVIRFKSGHKMKNRFMLAPLTNQQSNEDGTLSDKEFTWLTMRAKGGFGLVMTCASHVSKNGKGFPGQLGIFSDIHIEGHRKLATEIKKHAGLAVVQLHHAGMRSPKELISGFPLCPSDNEKHKARGLTEIQVQQLIQDFIAAAQRAQEAGYDGVEIHGAHGYILSQFLSQTINQRTDQYGGNLENRSRIIMEIIEGVRETCGNNFLLGVRLSPERFGMELNEIQELCQRLNDMNQIDFLDISLWDSFKLPEDNSSDKLLLDYFTELDLNNVRLTVAGNIRSSEDVRNILSHKVDFVTIGRSAILHHDFPKKAISDKDFTTIPTPVSKNHLRKEGLSDVFINYMTRWPDFVEIT